MFPAQWDLFMKKIANQKKGSFYTHKDNLLVYLAESDRYIGGADNFLEWALQEFRYVDNTVHLIYKKQANDAFRKTIHETEGRSYVQLHINSGDAQPEQVLIELFDDIAPKTCENFRELCKGHTAKNGSVISYARTEFTRIVKGKFIQGGDVRKAHGK